jgi:hypothetical protein
MLGASDMQQIEYAIKTKCVFLTHNRAHFEKLYTELIAKCIDHPGVTNKAKSKDTYFDTLPSIPSPQGRGNYYPSPLVGEGEGEGECSLTYALLSIIATRRNVYELTRRVSRVLSGYTKESIKNQLLYV